MINKNILIIYPEEAVTKMAVYRNTEPIFLKTIKHSEEDINSFHHFIDQIDFRLNAILGELDANCINLDNIEIIMGRSGLVKPVEQGVYEIDSTMVKDRSRNKLVSIFRVHRNRRFAHRAASLRNHNILILRKTH